MSSSTVTPTRVRYAVLGVLCSLAFLTYLDRICIMQVQEDIANDLNFSQLTPEDEQRLADAGQTHDDEAISKAGKDRSRERMGWVFFAFTLGYCLFEIPGGWLGDMWGPRVVIFRIVLWWSLFTALTGSVDAVTRWFAASPEPALLLAVLVVIRFLFGAGEAGAYPNIGRAIARWFPFRQRGSAQGAIWMASRFGGAVAPWIIVTLKDAFGWRQAFWTFGGIGAVWAAFFYFWFRNRPEEKSGVNAAECEVIRSGSTGPGSIYDDAGHSGVPWLRLLLSTNLWALSLTTALISFSWYFNITFLPQYLKDKFQMDFSESAYITGLPLLVGGVTCLLGGGLSDWLIRRLGSHRWGRSLPGLVGCSAAGICALVIPYVPSAYGVIAVLCVATALQDLCVPCFWTVTADIGGRFAGTVGGCMNSVGAVGAALSPVIVSKVVDADNWNPAFYWFAGAYFLAVLCWLRIDASESVIEPKDRRNKGL